MKSELDYYERFGGMSCASIIDSSPEDKTSTNSAHPDPADGEEDGPEAGAEPKGESQAASKAAQA